MARSTKQRQRREMKSLMMELLLFIPNLVWLLFGLLRDERVSRADKAILAGTILYVISPLDLIPDFIPFIGQVDDAYLIAISLMRLMNRTDGQVFREHWKGSIDLKDLVTSISMAAAALRQDRGRNTVPPVASCRRCRAHTCGRPDRRRQERAARADGASVPTLCALAGVRLRFRRINPRCRPRDGRRLARSRRLLI